MYIAEDDDGLGITPIQAYQIKKQIEEITEKIPGGEKFLKIQKGIMEPGSKIVSKVLGKKAKTKYRRAKKRSTREAAREAGDIDCLTGKYRAGGERGWPAKPHREYIGAYNLAWSRCRAALQDCRQGVYGASLPTSFPGQRSKDYGKLFKKGYDEWYQKCPVAAGGPGGIGRVDPKILLLLLLAGGAIMMSRR